MFPPLGFLSQITNHNWLITLKMDKVKTFALTLRPIDGVTDDQIDLLCKWVKKKCLYYFLITEKTMAARHVHAGLIMKNACTRANIVTYMMRLFSDLTPQEKTVFRSGIKIMYNPDFIGNYMNKDDDTVEILKNLPEVGHLEAFFPPRPVPMEAAKVKKCSIYYHELEKLWYEHTTPGYEIHTRNARNFLFEVMYNHRCLPVIRDDKMIIQTARHLVRWLNKSTESTIELPPFEKEE